MDDVKIIKLIKTRLLRRGDGKNENDPIRIITQYWNFDGELVIEYDPYSKGVHITEGLI